MSLTQRFSGAFVAQLATGLLVLMGLFALSTAPAMAQNYPPRANGPVYDGAGILSPQTTAQLDAKLRAYNQTTGRALVVATVPSLGGQTIESYATGLFANWGIGGDERDAGLLLLIAPNERKMRIEVGYGLHPYFGGIMAGRVIRDIITPEFKAGDYDGGVTAGVDAIIAHLNQSPEDAAAIEEAAAAAERDSAREGGDFPIGTLLWLGFMFFVFVWPVLRGRGGRRYRGGVGRDIGNIMLWEAANSAMRHGSSSHSHHSGGFGSSFGGGGGFSGGGGGFGGFGGGLSGGGGASGGW